MLALALAVLSAAGAEMAASPQRGKVAALRVADEHDVAAATAVAAVGTAARHMSLAAKADHAVAAAAGFHINLGSIEEHAAKVAVDVEPGGVPIPSPSPVVASSTSVASSGRPPPRSDPSCRGQVEQGSSQRNVGQHQREDDQPIRLTSTAVRLRKIRRSRAPGR
jgi:hypothetical protein